MIVSINQPAYLPWLGYFDRIRKSDMHVILDHVQFEKGSYTNRCRIKQPDGREMWLTIPVEKGQPINETLMTNRLWVKRHNKSLGQAYGLRAQPAITLRLFDVLYQATQWIWMQLGNEDIKVCRSSDLGGTNLGTKSDLVLNICKLLGATQYLSGPQGRNYLDLPSFEKAGIEVLYHDFPTDGDWGLSAVHHLSKGLVWPQVDLISAHFSEPSAAAEALAARRLDPDRVALTSEPFLLGPEALVGHPPPEAEATTR